MAPPVRDRVRRSAGPAAKAPRPASKTAPKPAPKAAAKTSRAAKAPARRKTPAPQAQRIAEPAPQQPDIVVRSAAFHFPENGISTLSLITKEHPHRVFEMRERRRIGSRYIRLASADEPPSVLATRAAEKALARAGLSGKDLDMVVTAGVTPPDYDLWSMPAKVARNLGADRAECFGFGEAACASPFAAIRSLVPMMRAPEGPERVLLVCGCVTPGGHFFEPATIYGDGGGALVLEKVPRARGPGDLRVVRADYYTDNRWVDTFGAAAGVKKLKADGQLSPADWTVRVKSQEDLRALIDFTGERGTGFVKKTLAKAGWAPSTLRWLVADNVAAAMTIDIASLLGMTEDRILLENTVRYGHAWVADMFVNLATIIDEHPPVAGDRLACVGIGQGENWGVFLLEAPAEET